MRDKRYGDMPIEDLMQKKRQRKAKKGERVRWNTIVINCIHQNFFYLDSTERWMRISWEVIPSIMFYCVLKFFMSDRCCVIVSIISIVAVHIFSAHHYIKYACRKICRTCRCFYGCYFLRFIIGK